MTPHQHPRHRLLVFGRDLVHEWRTDRVPDLAAEVAFYAILSLFPALLAMAAILGVLDDFVGADLAARAQDNVLDFLRSILTSEADSTLDAASELFTESRPGLLTFSLLASFWALSRGFAALVRALDVVYDLDEHRKWLHIRTTAIGLTIGSVLASAVMLSMIVVGPLFGTGEDIADEIGLGDQFVFLWDVIRLPLAFLVLILWAATIFHIAPDHHTPWRDDVPGAIVTGVLWVVFSAGLHSYVELAQTGNAIFGALGGVLIVMLWFWLLSLAVLIGGEVNELLLEHRLVHEAEANAEVEARDDAPDSEFVEGGPEPGHEGAGFDGGTAVEEDAHDRRRDHDPV